LTPIQRSLVQTLIERGKLDEAHALLERASAIDLRVQGADSVALIDDDALTAKLAVREGKLPEAQALFDAVIARQRAGNVPPVRLADSLSERSVIGFQLNLLDNAERDALEAVDLFRRSRGELSLEVAENLGNLGSLRMRRGNAASAEADFRATLAVYQRLLPAEHPLISTAMTNLARSLDLQSKPVEAEAMYKDALAMQRRLFGDTHVNVVTTLNNLAVLYIQRGDYAQGRDLMQQTVDIWTRLAGPTHPYALAARMNLGVTERELGNYAQARLTLQSMLDDSRKVPGTEVYQPVALYQLGVLAQSQQHDEEAVTLHQQAVAVFDALTQQAPVERANNLIGLSMAEHALGRDADAGAHAEQAVALYEAANAQTSLNYSAALLARARVALRRGDVETAGKDARAALDLRRARFGESDPRIADAELALAEVEAATGQRAEAARRARAARTRLQAKGGAAPRLMREADRVLRQIESAGR
jgi:tetratricopeptide (TPR) repeat protein